VQNILFGTPLQALPARCGLKNAVPVVIIKCCEYLQQQNIIETEGILRVPGAPGKVEELKDLFDQGELSFFSLFSLFFVTQFIETKQVWMWTFRDARTRTLLLPCLNSICGNSQIH
jgi:hypothetical protein